MLFSAVETSRVQVLSLPSRPLALFFSAPHLFVVSSAPPTAAPCRPARSVVLGRRRGVVALLHEIPDLKTYNIHGGRPRKTETKICQDKNNPSGWVGECFVREAAVVVVVVVGLAPS